MADPILPGALALNGPYVNDADGWGDGMNQNLLRLSTLTQGVAASRTAVLPASPTDGYVAIVRPDDATNPNKVAVRFGGAWTYITPWAGLHLYVADAGGYATFNGTAWVDGLLAPPVAAEQLIARSAHGGFLYADAIESEITLTGKSVTTPIDMFIRGSLPLGLGISVLEAIAGPPGNFLVGESGANSSEWSGSGGAYQPAAGDGFTLQMYSPLNNAYGEKRITVSVLNESTETFTGGKLRIVAYSLRMVKPSGTP